MNISTKVEPLNAKIGHQRNNLLLKLLQAHCGTHDDLWDNLSQEVGIYDLRQTYDSKGSISESILTPLKVRTAYLEGTRDIFGEPITPATAHLSVPPFYIKGDGKIGERLFAALDLALPEGTKPSAWLSARGDGMVKSPAAANEVFDGTRPLPRGLVWQILAELNPQRFRPALSEAVLFDSELPIALAHDGEDSPDDASDDTPAKAADEDVDSLVTIANTQPDKFRPQYSKLLMAKSSSMAKLAKANADAKLKPDTFDGVSDLFHKGRLGRWTWTHELMTVALRHIVIEAGDMLATVKQFIDDQIAREARAKEASAVLAAPATAPAVDAAVNATVDDTAAETALDAAPAEGAAETPADEPAEEATVEAPVEEDETVVEQAYVDTSLADDTATVTAAAETPALADEATDEVETNAEPEAPAVEITPETEETDAVAAFAARLTAVRAEIAEALQTGVLKLAPKGTLAEPASLRDNIERALAAHSTQKAKAIWDELKALRGDREITGMNSFGSYSGWFSSKERRPNADILAHFAAFFDKPLAYFLEVVPTTEVKVAKAKDTVPAKAPAKAETKATNVAKVRTPKVKAEPIKLDPAAFALRVQTARAAVEDALHKGVLKPTARGAIDSLTLRANIVDALLNLAGKGLKRIWNDFSDLGVTSIKGWASASGMSGWVYVEGRMANVDIVSHVIAYFDKPLDFLLRPSNADTTPTDTEAKVQTKAKVEVDAEAPAPVQEADADEAAADEAAGTGYIPEVADFKRSVLVARLKIVKMIESGQFIIDARNVLQQPEVRVNVDLFFKKSGKTYREILQEFKDLQIIGITGWKSAKHFDRWYHTPLRGTNLDMFSHLVVYFERPLTDYLVGVAVKTATPAKPSKPRASKVGREAAKATPEEIAYLARETPAPADDAPVVEAAVEEPAAAAAESEVKTTLVVVATEDAGAPKTSPLAVMDEVVLPSGFSHDEEGMMQLVIDQFLTVAEPERAEKLMELVKGLAVTPELVSRFVMGMLVQHTANLQGKDRRKALGTLFNASLDADNA